MSLTNQQRKMIRRLQTRHGRRRSRFILCEGLRCCREALARRPELVELVVCSQTLAESADGAGLSALAQVADAVVHPVDDRTFSDLSATESPQGILCVLTRPEPPPAESRDPFVLILDEVQDPGNAGTIVRTAWAAGLNEVWVTRGAVDLYAPKTVRAGMGAQFALTLRQFDSLATACDCAGQLGFTTVWYASPDEGISCYSDEFGFDGAALVLGNEARGVSGTVPGRHVTIPMPGNAESLNVAQAATLLLFEGVRRGVLK